MEQRNVVHTFDGKAAASQTARKPHSPNMKKISFLIFGLVIVLGFITGGLVYSLAKPDVVSVTEGTDIAKLPAGTVFGSDDEKAFRDSAEGVLREGGLNGEGAYHLERPGGESQNVYLTSSVLDLSQLEGRTIKVWGETNAAQTAGWLMDVGRAQIIK